MIRIERLGNLVDFDPSPSMTMGNGQKPPDVEIMNVGDDCPHCRRGILRALGREDKRRYMRRNNIKVTPKLILYCDKCRQGNRN